MDLPTYKLNETVSSSELETNLEGVFYKIKNNEIGKAVILQDGQPNFILLDINKYEQIVANNEDIIQNNNEDIKKEELFLDDEISEEEEIQQALKSIESMNFDKDMRKLAEDKITDKVLMLREERRRKKIQELSNLDDEFKEIEDELNNIDLMKQKNSQIEEFWD